MFWYCKAHLVITVWNQPNLAFQLQQSCNNELQVQHFVFSTVYNVRTDSTTAKQNSEGVFCYIAVDILRITLQCAIIYSRESKPRFTGLVAVWGWLAVGLTDMLSTVYCHFISQWTNEWVIAHTTNLTNSSLTAAQNSATATAVHLT